MAVDNETPEETPMDAPPPTGEDITPNQDGGVLKAIVKAGDTTEEDRPAKGDTVTVHYVGTLTNGEEFDSSRRRNEKFQFKLGQGQVIKAWDIGVATMRRGEVAVLTCRSEYAYGEKGQGKIPPDATLVFEVELFDWSGEDLTEAKDGGIVRRILEAGTGGDKPVDNSNVVAHITGRLGDRVFDERDVTFVIGEGSEHAIPDGLETLLMQMEKGEVSQVTLEPKYSFGSKGHDGFGVPPDSTVKYHVKLESFDKAKEPWEMEAPERLAAAEIVKTKGTSNFKAGDFTAAGKHYKKMVDLLDYDTTCSDEEKAAMRDLILIAHLNLAMTYIKLQEYTKAVQSCDKALEIDSTNIKGLFRRGQANLAESALAEAKKDFGRVAELDPSNKAARNQLAVCLHKIKLASDREKRLYGNMFAKFAEQDRKIEETKMRQKPPTEFGGEFDTGSIDTPKETPEAQSEGDDSKTENDTSKGGGGDAPSNSSDAPSNTGEGMEVEV